MPAEARIIMAQGRLGDGGRELEIRPDEETSTIADCSIRERQRRFTATI
jgi:hypothetical protein